MDALPPFNEAMSPLDAAVDSLTMRDAPPPPILFYGGNTGGLFEHIRRNALDGHGVPVFRWDLTNLGASAPVETSRQVEEVVANSNVQEKVFGVLGAGADVLGHGLIQFALSLGELGQGVVSAWKASEPSLGPISPVVALLDSIRAAHPASVLFLGEVGDDQRRGVWETVLSWSRMAGKHENRVLVVAGLDRKYRFDPLLEAGVASALLRSVRTAVHHDRVTWTWLDRLSDPRIRDWIGQADREVSEALAAMSGRDDLVARLRPRCTSILFGPVDVSATGDSLTAC